MDNYIAMTYYHLMASLVLTLKSKRKSRLYVAADYLKIDSELIDKIKKLNLFEDVIMFNEGRCITRVYDDLGEWEQSTADEINHAISTNLTPFYKSVFKNCDPNDMLYIFNEMQFYYYYVEDFFNSIIKIEDGYKSFAQELQVHRFAGKREMLYKIEGNGFPITRSRSSKIKKIIISEKDDRIDDFYSNLIEIEDMNNLFKDKKLGFSSAIMKIFDIDNLEIKQPSILIITQPLARAKYCTIAQQYVVYEKICEKYHKEYNIYIKPHPADKVKYGNLDKYGAVIFDSNFPIDIFSYTDAHFDYGITFGSTSLENADYLEKKKMIFTKENFQFEDIVNFIDEYTGEIDTSISYLVDARYKENNSIETIKSLLCEDSNVKILVAYSNDNDELVGLKSENNYIELIKVEENLSKIKVRKLLYETSKTRYVLYADVDFTYSKNLTHRFKNFAKKKNYDLLNIGLDQYMNGKLEFRREFNKKRRESLPFFIQNRFIDRNVLRKCNFEETDTDDDLMLLIEININSYVRRSITKAYAKYDSVSKTPLLEYNENGFEQHYLMVQKLNEIRESTEDIDRKKGIYSFIISIIFRNMHFGLYSVEDRLKYNDFRKTEFVDYLKKDAFDIIFYSCDLNDKYSGVIDSPNVKKTYVQRTKNFLIKKLLK